VSGWNRQGDLIRYSGSGTVAGRAGHTAYLGDLLATHIAGRGLAAAVVDGLIRDRDVLPALPVSVFACGGHAESTPRR
jgi:regulator of RNase E activity RraA